MPRRSAAPLRVVDDAEAFPPTDPSELLIILFAQEAALKRQLTDVGRNIDVAIDHFMTANNLMMRPRTELLRTRFAPTQESQS